MERAAIDQFFHFRPPYRTLTREEAVVPDWGRGSSAGLGHLLLWVVGAPLSGRAFEAAQGRPPGLPLVVVLPAADAAGEASELLRIIELCRPHSVLPHHLQPSPLDLRALLRRPPDDLVSEVMDYLGWRGITTDQDTRHLVRRTLELSSELRTVSALSRSLYLSRRALGRRFLDRGLPVPSHWLHFGRVLRACLDLQNLESNLFDVACDHGYPDGFALSNQMNRLVGLRPSMVRENLGWEWILEAWLSREASRGGFAGEFRSLFLPGRTMANDPARATPSMTMRKHPRKRSDDSRPVSGRDR